MTAGVGRADPLVRSRPPGRLPRAESYFQEKSGTGASRADQGVRPTSRIVKSQASPATDGCRIVKPVTEALGELRSVLERFRREQTYAVLARPDPRTA